MKNIALPKPTLKLIVPLIIVIALPLGILIANQQTNLRSKAAGVTTANATAQEAEDFTASGNVTVGQDTNASGGKFIQLGQAGSGVTPTTGVTSTPTQPPATGSLRGWQLNATNTGLTGVGIDKNTLPLYSGTITAGSTISQKKLVDPDLSAGNITLDRCWIVSTGSGNLILGSVAGTITIKDSDLENTGALADAAFSVGVKTDENHKAVTILRSNIARFGIGFWPDGPGLMQQSWIHDQPSYGDPATTGNHVDGFTRRSGSSRVDLIDNFIDTRTANATGAIFLASTFGFFDNVHLSGNLFAGGGYILSVGEQGSPYGTNLTADNNRWLPRVGDNGYYGYAAVFSGGGFSTWTNNYVNDPAQTNNQGVVVPKP